MERKMEYVGFRDKYCDIVTISDGSWFDYRKGETELPKVGAFCRKCARETAMPVYPVYMNGKHAYALKCNKCGSEYAMYTNTFKIRYIGHTTPNGGRINPTHGTMSHVQAMDRKAREYHDSIPQRVEDEICEMTGMSHEEYKEMRKKSAERDRKAIKEYEKERAEYRIRFRNAEIDRESLNRKDLIERGILKYVKNIGLVNTETGEVVKL